MKLSIRHIEIFRAIMQAGSVTAAARLLFTSQPTVSRELARLESVLGMPLFAREGGRLLANAQALALYEEVERTYQGLERIHSTAQALRQFEQGQVRISCLPIFSQNLLPPACRAFLERYPRIGLHLSAQESPELESGLSGQRFDLGLLEHPNAPAGTHSELLLRADMRCVLPSGHPLLERSCLSAQDFQGQAFINLAGVDRYRQQVDAAFDTAGVERRTVIETNGVASVCAIVRQGLGVSIINPLTALDEATRGLHMRPIDLGVAYEVHLVRPTFRAASSLVDAFAQALRDHAAQLAQALPAITAISA